MAQERTARARYRSLAIRRESVLKRARSYAALTIPTLMPPEGYTDFQHLPEPHQGFGARLVTSLASKMTSALMPPGKPWFELKVPPEVLLANGEQSAPDDVLRGLAISENVVTAETERKRWRQPTYVALLQLIVTGNALEEMLPDNTIRVFRLDQYVVVRNPLGQLTELLIEEQLSPASMDDELRELADIKDEEQTKTFPLYTWAVWDAEEQLWFVHQELNDKVVPESEGEFTILPYNALRWTAVVGEDYGRGKVEEHAGDFRALDGLSKNVIDGGAMASRHIQTVSPSSIGGGINLARKVTNAENGDVIIADTDDIGMLSFENIPGLQVAAEELNNLKRELAAAFILNSSVRRDAERVTAFELQMMVEEIEGVLGGVFTTLAGELQESRLRRLLFQMKAQGKLPNWPEELIEPTIMTGLEALSREREMNRVAQVLQFIGQLPEQIVMDYPKWELLLDKIFIGAGIPEAVRSNEEVQQRQQQRMEQEAAMQAAGRLATQAQ